MEEIKFKTGDIIRNIKDNTILRVIIVYRGAIGHFYDCEDLRTGEEGKVFNEGEWEVVDDSEKQLSVRDEIERLLKECSSDWHFDEYQEGRIDALKDILKLMDSTSRNQEPEQESGDLEEEFNRFLDDVEGVPPMWHSDEQIEWAKDIARHFAEWCEKQVIEKACRWIKEHHHDFTFLNREEGELEFETESFINNFRKAMEDET